MFSGTHLLQEIRGVALLLICRYAESLMECLILFISYFFLEFFLFFCNFKKLSYTIEIRTQMPQETVIE